MYCTDEPLKQNRCYIQSSLFHWWKMPFTPCITCMIHESHFFTVQHLVTAVHYSILDYYRYTSHTVLNIIRCFLRTLLNTEKNKNIYENNYPDFCSLISHLWRRLHRLLRQPPRLWNCCRDSTRDFWLPEISEQALAGSSCSCCCSLKTVQTLLDFTLWMSKEEISDAITYCSIQGGVSTEKNWFVSSQYDNTHKEKNVLYKYSFNHKQDCQHLTYI